MNVEKIAKIISFLLGPFVWMPVLIVIFLLNSGLTRQQQTVLFPALIFFHLIIPTIFLYVLIKLKKVSDWDVQDRKQRYKILPIVLGSWTIAGIFVYYFGNELLLRLFLIIIVLAFLMTAITRVWKISLHAGLNTSAIMLVNFLFSWQLPWLYILIPVVCWSRYVLKHHTVWQLVAGVVVSAVFVLISLVAL